MSKATNQVEFFHWYVPQYGEGRGYIKEGRTGVYTLMVVLWVIEVTVTNHKRIIFFTFTTDSAKNLTALKIGIPLQSAIRPPDIRGEANAWTELLQQPPCSFRRSTSLLAQSIPWQIDVRECRK